MISKAKSLDQANSYICADLLNWIPDQKVDLVHSMEVFYFFENPKSLAKTAPTISCVDVFLVTINQERSPCS